MSEANIFSQSSPTFAESIATMDIPMITENLENKILSYRQDFEVSHPAKMELDVRASKLGNLAKNL